MPILIGADRMPGSEVAAKRSRVAHAARKGDAEELATARRDLAAAKLKAYITRVVDEAPPLTEAQRADLAALLRGGAA